MTVLALNAPFDVDRPEGKFAERLMEAADEFASDTIGFWVGVGLREKHERGLPLGRVPETFMAVATGKNRKGRADLRVPAAPRPRRDRARGRATLPDGRLGFGDLARWAQREGFRTPRGRALTDEWWRNVLASPTNAGYVGYRRKRGGTELRRAAFDGSMPLETFQQLQETRRRRTRRTGEPSTFEVYVLTGATCGGCGGKVTAQTKRRLRCRTASQHAGCAEPSVAASAVEAFFGDWIMKTLTPEPRDLARAVAIVRAKLHRGSDAQKATRIRTAMKRLTEAFTHVARSKRWTTANSSRRCARNSASRRRRPQEQRIPEATRIAQDIPRAWALATPEQRKRMVWSVFNRIRISSGAMASVRPKPETAALLAAAVHRCGPDRGWTRQSLGRASRWMACMRRPVARRRVSNRVGRDGELRTTNPGRLSDRRIADASRQPESLNASVHRSMLDSPRPSGTVRLSG